MILAANHSPDVGDLSQVLALFDQYVAQNPCTGYAREPRMRVGGL